MKLRKGKWEYLLPQETYQLLHAYLCMKGVHFNLCFVRPEEIIEMRKEAFRKNKGVHVQGNVSYVALAQMDGDNYLFVFPEPYKAVEMKLRATKIFEI